MTLMPDNFYGNGLAGPSINDQIRQAKSISDVHALLAKGRGFDNFSRRSENRWKRTAKRRIAELKNGAHQQ